MAIVTLGVNTSSLVAQRSLDKSSQTLSRVFERLSSGQRINRASDDAAGLAIASMLEAKARVFTQGVRNISDGVSFLSIAEGALGQLSQITQRQMELAEQSANGTYSLAQRKALDNEANALVNEFNRITQTTSFNGLSVFDLRAGAGDVRIQAGYGISGSINVATNSQLGRTVGTGTFSLSSANAVSVSGIVQKLVSTTFDVNHDGKLDIVFQVDDAVGVMFGNGDGSFGAAQSSALGEQVDVRRPDSVLFGDFNGDGNLDVIAESQFSTVNFITLGNADGSFRAQATMDIAFYSNSGAALTAGDVNGDGILDLVQGDPGALSVALGNGNGSFRAARTVTADIGTISIVDVNGDGTLDLLTTDSGSSKIVVRLGNGNGTFKLTASYSTSNSNHLTVGDFNHDGVVDIASAGGGSNVAEIRFGNGDGSFKATSTFATGLGFFDAISITSGDINGDGIADLLLTSNYSTSLGVLLGNSNGSFQATKSSQLPLVSSSISLGDVDQNGVLDLVAGAYVGFSQAQVSILRAVTERTTTTQQLDLLSQGSARNALTLLTNQLNRISSEQGVIGANMSRLQSASSTLSVSKDNFLAAESRIKDADIAQESAQLTRTTILQQAASAVLGQANQQPALALKLLSG